MLGNARIGMQISTSVSSLARVIPEHIVSILVLESRVVRLLRQKQEQLTSTTSQSNPHVS